MAKSSSSPRMRQRQSLHQRYRARGKSNSNLWLVYSVKTERDWILSSDRELIHWLCLLEFDAEVRSFDLTPEPVPSFDAQEPRSTELDAIVEYRNGRREWREIKAKVDENSEAFRSQFQAQAAAAQQLGGSYRIVTDAELQPLADLAIRWLSALSFATALRGRTYRPAMTALHQALRNGESGHVRDLLTALAQHDEAVIAGLVVRAAVAGQVELDLSVRGFGRTTRWQYLGD